MTPRVLFLHNDPVATEALLGEAFSDAGFDIDTFTVVPAERAHQPAVDVVFPDPTGYDVIVPLGARWPVYDEALRNTWVGAEMAMLREAAAAGVALLGVCFGGQLIAQTFGGTVGRGPVPEIGWYDITTDRPELVAAGPWFQWHFDRWTLPPGAVEIARTADASQAFVLGRCLALQFHPELDHALLVDWLADDRDGEALALGLDHDELLTQTRQLGDDAAKRIRGLVNAFLTYVAAAPCPS
ncbi:type 1 glutamine amidotransferase [Mycolicibacterium litorale]|uniref:Glutamine amidotransferase n=1 Tax=Mycolicibacterium litorale TaxID=758802 RepID=A0AAD1IKV4_9MYCO|nr:type 1 glutamine amidotransferase [Mycolicibacterium litorale]MCV7414376.1 type 1 glutamine amidotransferase [Mycolicibacterium litorale]TDY01360.1 GMP synthase-like glutamine amidotransferase [Mycolicibacterium litorale]BBY15427.1 glutamine amidotransferase [Mycolicibacterium litorale]